MSTTEILMVVMGVVLTPVSCLPTPMGPADNQLTTPVSETGPVSSVPEPESLRLLSLGLGAIILWRKLRNPRLSSRTRVCTPLENFGDRFGLVWLQVRHWLAGGAVS